MRRVAMIRPMGTITDRIRPRPVAGRVQLAGVLMLLESMFWVLMPVGMGLGLSFSSGIGIFVFNSRTPVVVSPDMLVWVWPMSLLTTAAGVLLLFGRGYRLGLAVSLAWVGIAIAGLAAGRAGPELVLALGIVAGLIYTGRNSFVPRPAMRG